MRPSARVVLLLAALWGASCASSSSSSRPDLPLLEGSAKPLSEVLQGCAVDDDGSLMRCGGVALRVHDGPTETTFDERAEKRAEDLLAKATIDDARVDVLGRAEVVRRARIAAVYGDAHLTTLLHATAPGADGRGTRAFTCDAPADVPSSVERCVELIASYLAEAPSRAAQADAVARAGAAGGKAPGLAFGRRTLPLPPGCRAEAAPPGGRLVCPTSVVAWRPFGTMEEATAAAEEATAPYEALANAVVERGVPCRVASTPATCTRARIDGDETVIHVAAVLSFDGAPLAATCRTASAAAAAEACGGVVEAP